MEVLLQTDCFGKGDTLSTSGQTLWRAFFWGNLRIMVEYTQVVVKGPTLTMGGNYIYVVKNSKAEFYYGYYKIYTRRWKNQ